MFAKVRAEHGHEENVCLGVKLDDDLKPSLDDPSLPSSMDLYMFDPTKEYNFDCLWNVSVLPVNGKTGHWHAFNPNPAVYGPGCLARLPSGSSSAGRPDSHGGVVWIDCVPSVENKCVNGVAITCEDSWHRETVWPVEVLV